MIADFRRQGHIHGAIRIQGEKVEVVLKYPGTIFEDTRKWDFNTEATTKKGTSDSICCGSSDLLTLIQLFLRSSDLLTLIQLFLRSSDLLTLIQLFLRSSDLLTLIQLF